MRVRADEFDRVVVTWADAAAAAGAQSAADEMPTAIEKREFHDVIERPAIPRMDLTVLAADGVPLSFRALLEPGNASEVPLLDSVDLHGAVPRDPLPGTKIARAVVFVQTSRAGPWHLVGDFYAYDCGAGSLFCILLPAPCDVGSQEEFDRLMHAAAGSAVGVLRCYLAVNRLIRDHAPRAPKIARIRLPEQRGRRLCDGKGEPRNVRVWHIAPGELKAAALPAENGRGYDRHCPAWGVRGHWRHYRSGKVVFIRAHVKGPERGKGAPGRAYDTAGMLPRQEDGS